MKLPHKIKDRFIQSNFDYLASKLNAPDYDSGWLADNNLTNGLRTYTHNLNLAKPPSHFKLWFSPDQIDWWPVGEGRGMGTNEMSAATAAAYHNPCWVLIRTNTLLLGVYMPVAGGGAGSMPIWSAYNGTGWANYASGFWRYYIWR